MVYRSCAQAARLGPREVDELELWEVAAVIGGNDPPDSEDGTVTGEQAFNLNERPVPDGPSVFSAWRALAISEGREPPGFGDKITAEEHAQVLQLIRGGHKAGA